MGKQFQAALALLAAMAMVSGSSAFAAGRTVARAKSTHKLMKPHIRASKTRKKVSRAKKRSKVKSEAEQTPEAVD